MTLSPTQRLQLLATARKTWIDVQVAIYAFEDAFHKTNRMSEWLRWSSIAFGVLTAASAVWKDFQPATIGLAMISAAIAGVDKYIAPAERSERYWSSSNQLRGVRSDLNSFALLLEDMQDVAAGNNAMRQIEQKWFDLNKTPYQVTDRIRDRATADFNDTSIAAVLIQTSEPSDQDADLDALQLGNDEGVPDVLGVRRRIRHGEP